MEENRPDGTVAVPSKRNDGIDLLRIVCMYMVVVLHVIGQGGILVRVSSHIWSYHMCWLMETFCFCTVNVYGMISGYVGVKQRFRLSRIVRTWVLVYFWTAVIGVVLLAANPSWVDRESLLSVFLPVTWDTYWYATDYIALLLLMPFLNRMVEALTDKQRGWLMNVIFIYTAWMFIPKVFSDDFLEMIGGYSLIWLILLYMFGACMRMKGPGRRPVSWYLMVYVVTALVSWGAKLGIESVTQQLLGEPKYGRLLLNYTAPTILICAWALINVFSQLQLAEGIRRIVRLMTPAAFGVYLIHAHPLIWEHILKLAFFEYRHFSAWQMIPAVLLTALGIFVPCLLLSWCQTRLFAVLKVPERIEALCRRVHL